MSHAGWLDVWKLVLALISREPPVVVIVFWLAVVFAVLMMAEGLRANFFPFRPVAPRGTKRRVSEPAYAPQPETSAAGAGTSAFEATTLKFAPRPLARNPRRRIISLKRQTPPKPRIQRLPREVDPPQAGPVEATVFEPEQPPQEAMPQELLAANEHHLAALPPEAYAAVQAANVA